MSLNMRCFHDSLSSRVTETIVAAKELAVKKCVVARTIAMRPTGRGVRRHSKTSCILVISRLKNAVGR